MKKLFVIGLCLLLTVAPLSVSAAEPILPMTKGLPGDVNNDGRVDSEDALLVLTCVVGVFDERVKFSPDINGNQKTEATDALEILKHTLKKDSVISQNTVETYGGNGDSYTYWPVIKDEGFSGEQAWLCQSYEEYQTFLNFGYVEERSRKLGRDTAHLVPEFHETFFETHNLLLWYRPYDKEGRALRYYGTTVKEDCAYLYITPYDSVNAQEANTTPEIYGFWFQKGEQPCRTVVMRQTVLEAMYLWYETVQFDFPAPNAEHSSQTKDCFLGD